MNRTAKLLGVSMPRVMAWIEQFAHDPQPALRRYEKTHSIECDNARQRHWLAPFRRRSIVVSRAKHMVEAAVAFVARFGGNDRIADLVSMLA